MKRALRAHPEPTYKSSFNGFTFLMNSGISLSLTCAQVHVLLILLKATVKKRKSMVDFRKMVLLPLLIWFIQKSTITSASIIPDEFSSISTLFQSRMKRDNDYKVKCHQSGTGKVIFLEHIRTSMLKVLFPLF